MAMKKTLLSMLLIGGVSTLASANAEIKDPYLEGFKAYAAELKSMKDPTAQAYAEYVSETQKAERSAGYIGDEVTLPEPVKVTEGVYTVVGSMIWHNPTNFGLNNNLTFIEFEDGVFVFNAGPNTAVAYSFHQIIKRHTDKPVKWVAVENSQGHAYLGASYWVDVGVKNFYSHSVANQTFHKYFDEIKASWSLAVGNLITLPSRDVTAQFTEFDDPLVVETGGGESMTMLNFGAGHTPGSTLVYIPSRNLLLTGDVAYNERSLALFAYTDTKKWVETFARMMEYVPEDVIVIPGHGAPTTMQRIKEDTYDYLVFLRAEVEAIIKAGGSESDVVMIDQSRYKDRPVYDQTHQNNAVHIYKEMTGESLGESFE